MAASLMVLGLLTVVAGAVIVGLYRDAVRQAEAATRAAAHARAAEQWAAEERDAARAAQRQADRELQRAEWLLYAGQLAVAQREWAVGHAAAAWHHLNGTRPEFRGWEYRHLHAQFNQHQLTLRGHSDCVLDVAWSPDGRRVVTAGQDQTARVWDATTGRETLTFRSPKTVLTGVAWRPDGTRILTVHKGRGEGVTIWDAETGRELRALRADDRAVLCAAWHPDGSRIVGGSADGTVTVWNADTG